MDLVWAVENTAGMESLPRELIDTLSSVLQGDQRMSWHIHGTPDKVVMNIMWSSSNQNAAHGRSESSSPKQSFVFSSKSPKVAKTDHVGASIQSDSKPKQAEKIIFRAATPVFTPRPTSSQSTRSSGSSGDKKGRKKLPTIPDTESQQSMSAALQNKNNSAMPAGNGYGPALLEYKLMFEYDLLQKQRLPGIYVMPSAVTPFVWNGVLFIRQGLYQAAVLKFTLTIPENFPDADVPEIYFDTPVFHPLVDAQTGRLDVKRGFQKWRRNVNHLWEVLLYTRMVFYKIDTYTPLNQEAAHLYEHNICLYKQRAAETVRESRDRLYDADDDTDANAISFTPWDENVHEPVRQNMIQLGSTKTVPSESETESHRRNGLSWIKPKTNKIFSRDDSSS